MRKWLIICLLAIGLMPVRTSAQDDYNTKANKYITKYGALAVAEQRRSGVPASIILAQGILETEAGCSELCCIANNHFGIKCRKEWTGATFAHDDDRPQECFRKYNCAEDSYKDHSDYLLNSPRYASLFKLSPTDYASWAIGLKRCGYATNPKYAPQLIKIIEDFHLQEYTYAALNNKDLPEDNAAENAGKQAEALDKTTVADNNSSIAKVPATVAVPATLSTTPAQMQATPKNARQQTNNIETAKGNGVYSVNGLRAIKGVKGDMLLQYALKYNIRYERLLEYNDLPDAPLPANMYVYLERKNYKGKNELHTVKSGENLLLVSQIEGIQLKRLMALNRINIYGEEPLPGEVLRLQTICEIKPKVAFVNKPKKPIVLASADSSGYVSTHGTTQNTAPKFTYIDKPNNPNSKIKITNEGATIAVPHTIPLVQAVATEPVVQKSLPVSQIIAPKEQTVPTVKVTTADTLQEAPEQQNTVVASNPSPITKTEVVSVPVTQPAKADTVAIAQTAKTDTIVAVTSAKPVDTVKQEPLDEVDAIKARFDKLIYANKKKAVVATPKTIESPKAEIASATVPTGDDSLYTVKEGDTAYSIAKDHHITLHQLMDWNNLDFDKIQTGQRLIVKK